MMSETAKQEVYENRAKTGEFFSNSFSRLGAVLRVVNFTIFFLSVYRLSDILCEVKKNC